MSLRSLYAQQVAIAGYARCACKYDLIYRYAQNPTQHQVSDSVVVLLT